MTNAGIEQAVQVYLSKLTPEQVARSNAYFEGGYWIALWGFLLGLAWVVLLMQTGFSARLRTQIERWSRFTFMRDSLYVFVYLLLNSLFTLPFTIYTDFFREHQYGLSNQTFVSYFGDFLKATLIGLIFFPLFLAVIYAIIRCARRTWWIWGTVATTLGLMFVIMIVPVFLAPVFNTYKPLSPGPVRDSILQMARSNGISADEVWEFDASRQSNRVSANVSGLFGTTRISLNDNLLKRCGEAEIRAVMGHEMGHFVMNHALKSLFMLSVLWLVGFAFMQWGMSFALTRCGSAWSVRGVGDIAGMPVLLFLFVAFSFFTMPVNNTIVRMQEVEADMFGLNLAREPDGEAEVALKLAEYRKMSPGPIEEFIFFDHPSGENRIRAAMTWKHYQAAPAPGPGPAPAPGPASK